MTGGFRAGRQTTKWCFEAPLGPKSSRGEQEASGAFARCRSIPWRGEERSSVVEWIGHHQGSFSDGDSRRVAAFGGYVRRSKSHPQWGQVRVTNGISASRSHGRKGYRGVRESVTGSCPAEPGASHCRVEHTFRFVDCRFRFEASCSLRAEEGARSWSNSRARTTRPSRRFTAERDVATSPSKTKVGRVAVPSHEGTWVEVRHASPLRRRSYPGRMR
jgi:hypothetical protein